MKSLRKRALKRKLHRFWSEWGVTKDEAVMFLGALSVVAFPFIAEILLSFFI